MQNKPPKKDLRSFFGESSPASLASNNARKRSRNSGGSAFAACPLCSLQFPRHKLELHASTCEGSSNATVEQSATIPRTNQVEMAKPLISANIFHHKTTQSLSSQARSEFILTQTEPLPGLFVFEDFITPEEEAQILTTMDDPRRDDYLPWNHSNFNGSHLGKRWGVHCNLRTRQVTPAEQPLPWFMREIIIPKLQAIQLPEMERVGFVPNEANAIDYRRKQGHVLKNHVDDRQMSKEPIANLSLAGDCYMTFINEKLLPPPTTTTTTSHNDSHGVIREKRVLLKRRCLQVMTGKARYDYSHGIRHADLLTDRRVSLTMRQSPLTNSNTTTTAAKLPANQPTLLNIFQKL